MHTFTGGLNRPKINGFHPENDGLHALHGLQQGPNEEENMSTTDKGFEKVQCIHHFVDKWEGRYPPRVHNCCKGSD